MYQHVIQHDSVSIVGIFENSDTGQYFCVRFEWIVSGAVAVVDVIKSSYTFFLLYRVEYKITAISTRLTELTNNILNAIQSASTYEP